MQLVCVHVTLSVRSCACAHVRHDLRMHMYMYGTVMRSAC